MKQEISYGKKDIHGGTDIVVCPAFCDVHVHFREPGRPDKETILTGCDAAAAGGYTCVCPMPNLDPVPDSAENLEKELEIIRRDAYLDVIPYASITLGRQGLVPVDVKALKGHVAAFSDDGSGVQDDAVMRRAMELIAAEDCVLAAHCEDKRFGTAPEGEWMQIERDLDLAAETGCPYHVCHISTKRSVDAIRRAKDRGVDVTCETAPHYLALTEDDIKDEGRFRMNPPIRTAEDRKALIEGILDGTIDMIATDHAPHTAEEKSRGFLGSTMGVVGLETSFPVLYTVLVRQGIIPLEKLIDMMSLAPRRRFRLPVRENDTVTIDLGAQWTIDSSLFRSKGHSTPFDGMTVWGRVIETVYKGKSIYHVK
ncbi:MAG: dihydroorotase [Bacteroidales bacterium]|nr:dihydroorotase [Bacteroidales bacterium]